MPEATAYDHVIYPNYPYRQSHPDRLSTLAFLMGMDPAPLARCRVLELGCGNGANLLPMACDWPESSFVGIDLAQQPIAQGQALIDTLGLSNIELLSLDVLAFPETMGSFDYIIAHGLYSWVPDAVREQIMVLCARHLAPQGVAFISYNTYPGCHVRNIVRDMLRYHVHNAPNAATKISQSQALLKFMAEAQPQGDEYGQMLRKELERVLSHAPEHLFHDDLSEHNHPVYFHQFEQHARTHGLRFLSEAEYFMMQPDQFPEQTIQQLAGLGDNVIAQQQYLDFLRCRRFRQSLLCRADVPVDHQVRPQRLAEAFCTFSGKGSGEVADPATTEAMTFTGDHQSHVTTNHPLAKAALMLLAASWPQAVAYSDILDGALKLLGRDEEPEDRQQLLDILMGCYGRGLINVHRHPPRLAAQPGPRPMANPLARSQAATDGPLTSQLHLTVFIKDALVRRAIQLLDGSRSVAELTAQLQREAQEMHSPEQATIAPGDAGRQQVESLLAHLARTGLLVA